MRQNIIIDTDPGQDDAVAILLALASPELEVLGITCVAGNVPLTKTIYNARQICELSGKIKTPIFAGCDRPMRRDLTTAEHVHGKTGLDGVTLPEPKIKIETTHAVDFIIETLRASPSKSITLCPLGPLTNIGTALKKAPDIADRVQKIVLMGGAYFEVGNITPAAEFNIYVDPEAAEIVFKSGIELIVAPLDVTHKVLTNNEWVSELKTQDNYICNVVAAWTSFFERFDTEKYGTQGAPLHDPCVIAYVINPELFAGRSINVEIETMSKLTRGMTVADWWGVTDRSINALFLNDVDAIGYFKLITDRLTKL